MNLPSLLRLPARAYRRLVGHAPAEAPRNLVELEAARLRAVPTIPCDASPLGVLSEADLRDILAASELAAAWEETLPARTGLELPEMTGGVNPGDQRALFHLVLALRARAVLEIGTHVGCSTVNLALALQRTGGRLLSVDVQDVNAPTVKPWLQYGARCSPREACDRIGCAALVRFHQADSLDFLGSCRESFDLIFLDGLHSAHQVYREIPLALTRLNPGGFVALHDYFPELRPLWSNNFVIPGPWLAVRRLQDEGAPLTAIPLGELPWPTKLGSRRTSLALLTGRV